MEPFLKSVFASLDLQYQSPSSSFPSVEAYATQFAKQLKPTSAVMVNGTPVIPTQNDARLEFQKSWLQTPLTLHQITSFDTHIIPGTGTYVILASGKVKFDDSGRNRLGETADLVANPITTQKRSFNGSAYGFSLTLVVDQAQITNTEAQLIDSFNYRVTHKPHDSIVQV